MQFISPLTGAQAVPKDTEKAELLLGQHQVIQMYPSLREAVNTALDIDRGVPALTKWEQKFVNTLANMQLIAHKTDETFLFDEMARLIRTIQNPELRESVLRAFSRIEMYSNHVIGAYLQNADQNERVHYIELFGNDPNPHVRAAALDAMVDIQNKYNEIPRLDADFRDRWIVAFAADPSPRIRLRVAEYLIDDLSTDDLRESIIRKLIEDPDSKIQTNAANAAEHLEDKGRAIMLVQELAQHRSPHVRQGGISALLKMDTDAIRDDLLVGFINDALDGKLDDNGVFIAAEALSIVHNPVNKAELITRFAKHADNSVRGQAAEAIATLRPNAGTSQAQIDAEKLRLIKIFGNDKDAFDVRRPVFEEAIPSIEDDQLKAQAILMFMEEPDSSCQYSLAKCVKTIKDEMRRVEVMKAFLKRQDEGCDWHHTAVYSSKSMESDEAKAEAARACLTFPKRTVQDSGLLAITAISDRNKQIQLLDELALDDRHHVRSYIAYQMPSTLTNDELMQRLESLATSTSWQAKGFLLLLTAEMIKNNKLTLTDLPARERLRIITTALKDEHPGVRLDAVSSIGQFAQPSQIQALFEPLLQDSDMQVREEACELLPQNFTRPRAGLDAVLLKLAADPSDRIRQKIAFHADTLFYDGLQRDKALEILIRDKDKYVRQKALQNLRSHSDKQRCDDLLEAALHRETDSFTLRFSVNQVAWMKRGAQKNRLIARLCNHKEAFVRQEAYQLLSHVNDDTLRERLVASQIHGEQIINGPQQEVFRHFMAEAVSSLRDSEPYMALLNDTLQNQYHAHPTLQAIDVFSALSALTSMNRDGGELAPILADYADVCQAVEADWKTFAPGQKVGSHVLPAHYLASNAPALLTAITIVGKDTVLAMMKQPIVQTRYFHNNQVPAFAYLLDNSMRISQRPELLKVLQQIRHARGITPVILAQFVALARDYQEVNLDNLLVRKLRMMLDDGQLDPTPLREEYNTHYSKLNRFNFDSEDINRAED